MNTGCKVTLIPQEFKARNPGKCGQPIVNVERRLCAQHEADRIRLGGTP